MEIHFQQGARVFKLIRPYSHSERMVMGSVPHRRDRMPSGSTSTMLGDHSVSVCTLPGMETSSPLEALHTDKNLPADSSALFCGHV